MFVSWRVPSYVILQGSRRHLCTYTLFKNGAYNGHAKIHNYNAFYIYVSMVSGNTESLNYVGNDGTCDHSWLMMLLGNATLVSAALSRTHLMPSAGLSVFLLLVHILFSPPANSQRVHKRHFTSLLLHVCPLLLLFCIQPLVLHHQNA